MEKFSSMVHWVQSEKMETFTQRMAVSPLYFSSRSCSHI